MLLPALLVLLALAVFAAILIHARVVFVIELTDGAAQVRRGSPPAGFVSACEEVACVHRVKQGRISGIRTGAGTQLRFSPEIPARAHQPFRNVWNPSPPGGGGGGNRATG